MSVCLTKTIHLRKGRMHDDALRDEELTREEIRSDPIYLTLYKECQKKSKSPKVKAFLDWMDET